MLRDHAGYTMRLLTGYGADAQPDRWARHLRRVLCPVDWRRRTTPPELLAKTAGLLARLHAVPLVYADVSPNNVFISETADANEVWLIDLDNLDYPPPAHRASSPGLCAPEVGTDAPVSRRSGPFLVLRLGVLGPNAAAPVSLTTSRRADG